MLQVPARGPLQLLFPFAPVSCLLTVNERQRSPEQEKTEQSTNHDQKLFTTNNLDFFLKTPRDFCEEMSGLLNIKVLLFEICI